MGVGYTTRWRRGAAEGELLRLSTNSALPPSQEIDYKNRVWGIDWPWYFNGTDLFPSSNVWAKFRAAVLENQHSFHPTWRLGPSCFGKCKRNKWDRHLVEWPTWGRGWMTKASGVGERRKGRGELRRDCHHRVAALFVPTRMQQWYMIYDI